MRAYLKLNGSELPLNRIVEFLLVVRDNMNQGVWKPVAIEIAANQISTQYRTGRRIWANRHIWLKKGR